MILMKTQISINIPVWMILGLLVVIFFIYMIIWLSKKDEGISKKTSEDHLHEENSSINWIEKKDLLYWLIIISLGSISIFSFKYKTADEVIDHWGFAGTIVSIILAVLAIIYTYYQSATTVDSTKRLERSTKKVQKATARVEKATEELENNNVNQVVSQLEEKLHFIILEMRNDFKQDLHSKFSSISELIANEISVVDSNLDLKGINWQEYLQSAIIKKLTIEGLVFLYLYYLYENEKLYSMDDTIKFLKNMNYAEDDLENGWYLILGEVRTFKFLNIISYEPANGSNENNEIARVTKFNDSLERELKGIFESSNQNVLIVKLALDKTFNQI